MIISTKICNPFKTSFLLFNIMLFILMKLMVIDKINQSTPKAISGICIILMATFIAVTYALLDIFIVYLKEKKVVSLSSYASIYGCYLYFIYNTPYIFKLGKEKNEVYVYQPYLFLTQYTADRLDYIKRIKSRINNLTKLDIVYVYLYKYTSAVLMSLNFFVIWYVFDFLDYFDPAFHVLTLLVCTLGLTLVYFEIINIVMRKLTRVMKNRDLSIFLN